MRQRWQSSPWTGIPRPAHQRRFHVGNQVLDGTVTVFCRVLQCPAQVPCAQSLPGHGRVRRWQLPISGARRSMLRFRVLRLMARGAPKCARALSVGSALHVHSVRVIVLPLQGASVGNVAIQTAWAGEDRSHRTERKYALFPVLPSRLGAARGIRMKVRKAQHGSHSECGDQKKMARQIERDHLCPLAISAAR